VIDFDLDVRNLRRPAKNYKPFCAENHTILEKIFLRIHEGFVPRKKRAETWNYSQEDESGSMPGDARDGQHVHPLRSGIEQAPGSRADSAAGGVNIVDQQDRCTVDPFRPGYREGALDRLSSIACVHPGAMPLGRLDPPERGVIEPKTMFSRHQPRNDCRLVESALPFSKPMERDRNYDVASQGLPMPGKSAMDDPAQTRANMRSVLQEQDARLERPGIDPTGSRSGEWGGGAQAAHPARLGGG
jgi:hypothetical protein